MFENFLKITLNNMEDKSSLSLEDFQQEGLFLALFFKIEILSKIEKSRVKSGFENNVILDTNWYLTNL